MDVDPMGKVKLKAFTFGWLEGQTLRLDDAKSRWTSSAKCRESWCLSWAIIWSFIQCEEPEPFYGGWLYDVSGQIIATSHNLTPNRGLLREGPLFQGNLGWWNILIWPDIYVELIFSSEERIKHGIFKWIVISNIFFVSALFGGRFLIWLIFFKGVKITN